MRDEILSDDEFMRAIDEGLGTWRLVLLPGKAVDALFRVFQAYVSLLDDRDRLAARLAEVERERDEAEDFRSEIVIDAFTAPDADWDTILDSLRSRIQDLATTPLDDLVYDAWAVIANVGHKQGGWEAQDPEWVEAAIRWRDRFHESLRDGWEECPDCGAPQVTDHGDGTWSCPNRECVNADPASDQLPVPEQTTAEPGGEP